MLNGCTIVVIVPCPSARGAYTCYQLEVADPNAAISALSAGTLPANWTTAEVIVKPGNDGLCGLVRQAKSCDLHLLAVSCYCCMSLGRVHRGQLGECLVGEQVLLIPWHAFWQSAGHQGDCAPTVTLPTYRSQGATTPVATMFPSKQRPMRVSPTVLRYHHSHHLPPRCRRRAPSQCYRPPPRLVYQAYHQA